MESPRFTAKISTILEFLLDETPFDFYSIDSDAESNVVYVTLGGLNSIEVCALAESFSLVQLENTNWWIDYLLYHRKLRKTPGAIWTEPALAAGIDLYDINEKVAAHEAHLMLDMIEFVLAHEVGHIALNHHVARIAGESISGYLDRRRGQELAADHFALEVAKSCGIGAIPPMTLALSHLIIYEQESVTVLGSTHPADYERLEQVIKFFANPDSGSAEDEQQSLRDMEKQFTPPNDSTPLYEWLDAKAGPITLESLNAMHYIKSKPLHPRHLRLHLPSAFSKGGIDPTTIR